MRAAFYERFGGPEVVDIGEQPVPEPRPGRLLIRTQAAAVGRWDVNEMKGAFGNLPFPVIPGYEVAGVVEDAAPGSGFAAGDAVVGHLAFPGGGCAEYASLPVKRAVQKPAGTSFTDIVGLVVSGGTAYEGLVDRAHVTAVERVLITAAAGGVGTSAVQIAVAFGARVLAVASAPDHAMLRELGASATYDYHDPTWAEAVRGDVPQGVDVLFDAAGAATGDLAQTTLRPGARAVFIVGASAPERPRPDIEVLAFSADVTSARLQAIAMMVERGQLRTVIDSTYALVEARRALERVATAHARGRVTLSVD